MNENFFGKYSVFCVFGSVVGCVVVPLVAQVLRQQSMECMILSAIFLTLTAAHLKKGGSDSHSKFLLSRESDRKKLASNNNANKKQKSTNTHHNNNHHGYQQNQSHRQRDQHEQEYMQQHEHLRILEMEKRNEEKRLKKQKKREERLRKKEEENKKQKEIEDKYKALKEKRRKLQQKENNFRTNNTYNTATNNYEKYCCVDSSRTSSHPHRRSRAHSQDDEHRVPHPTFNKHGYTTRQNIPRFNTRKNNTVLSSHENGNLVRSNSEVLSINCSSLSASCSSLSSISSSGSCSPPPPTSPKSLNDSAAWKTPYQFSDSDSTKSLSPYKFDSNSVRQDYKKSWSLNGNIAEETQQEQQQQRVLKSYTNVRPVRNKLPTYNFNSSSLFCSNQEDDSRKQVAAVEEVTDGGEYSLFGSHQFGNSFIKSPVI